MPAQPAPQMQAPPPQAALPATSPTVEQASERLREAGRTTAADLMRIAAARQRQQLPAWVLAVAFTVSAGLGLALVLLLAALF